MRGSIVAASNNAAFGDETCHIGGGASRVTGLSPNFPHNFPFMQYLTATYEGE